MEVTVSDDEYNVKISVTVENAEELSSDRKKEICSVVAALSHGLYLKLASELFGISE